MRKWLKRFLKHMLQELERECCIIDCHEPGCGMVTGRLFCEKHMKEAAGI